ncbi:MAG: polysaccharide pyruvyl transferase family protein [Tannerella sp.]|jgi:hypothetical protein|nr:polysaccharide pyruvyl transferase family protein [Tannerella sp.]
MNHFVGLKYRKSFNLGDYIQSIAVERFLPKINCRLDRDTLATLSGKKKRLLVTNGWFSHTPEMCFPFSHTVIPLFYGLHITNWNNSWSHFLKPESIEYLNTYAPVGCRDRYTAKVLENHGVQTFYSKCLSLTLPRRKTQYRKDCYMIVDAEHISLPGFIKDKSIYLTHMYMDKRSESDAFGLARQLLQYYMEKATVIITSRLHCALPCLAMGIPVIFFNNPSDYRVSLLEDIGIKINAVNSQRDTDFWTSAIQQINFDRIEKNKSEITDDFTKRLDVWTHGIIT